MAAFLGYEAIRQAVQSLDDLPPAVRASLRAELAVLPESVRMVARAAAVAGDSFGPDLVAAVAGTTRQETDDALDELVARHLLRPAESGHFAYRHPIVRAAARADAGAGWLVQVHARLARATGRHTLLVGHGSGLARQGRLREAARSLADGEEAAMLARAHLAAGDPERCLDHLTVASAAARMAAAEFATSGNPLGEGQARLVAADAMYAIGDHQHALEELEQARTLFDRCGALGLRDQATLRLRGLGRRVPRGVPGRHSPRDAVGPAALTRRESEVAELVATGLTNRQIAAKLYLSPRTVEHHVEHIIAKLGLTSRSGVAAAIHTAGGKHPADAAWPPTT